jgi:hypothetical protein
MASILFYFLLRLSSIASETITLHPPSPLRCPPVAHPFATLPCCTRVFWLVVVIPSVVLRPFKAAAYLVPLIFCQSILRPVQGDKHPPTRSALAASPLQSPPQHRR